MLKHTDIEEIHENKIIDMREEYTYGTEISIDDKTKIKNLIKTCQEMIYTTKEIVFE